MGRVNSNIICLRVDSMELPFQFPEGFPDHFREVCEFRFSLNAETDRGCALMVASFLDYKIEQLLTARFVNDPKSTAEHLSQSGPLGTFSSRIDAAYLLGIIGENVRRDIHLIRKIRNEFGHSHKPLLFTDERIRDRCRELFHFHAIETTDDPRKKFVKTTMSILAVLNTDLHRIQHLSPGTDLYVGKEGRAAHKAEIQKMADTLLDGSPESVSQVMEAFASLLGKEGGK